MSSDFPISHKTIFLFDHTQYFAGQEHVEIENLTVKLAGGKAASSAASPTIRINKSLWTCNVEAGMEFARIVYDIFPNCDKLIRLMVSKFDSPLNSWSSNEQSLDFLMNTMGIVPPPSSQTVQSFDGENFINLCKALNATCLSMVQASDAQKIHLMKHNQPDAVQNSGRVVVLTSLASRPDQIEQIEQFVSRSIEELNKSIDQLNQNRGDGIVEYLKINMLELIIIDIVPSSQEPHFDFNDSRLRQISPNLRTRLIGCKSGPHLTQKLIQLSQDFYELSVTSITNIPMKEEQNANSSANYDVEILHSKLLHDQLKLCGLYKSCLVSKDGVDTVCLKWSNPKTNIKEFNLSSRSFRITPIDVNSRPATCLSTFILGGRCVILEIPRVIDNAAARVSSHFLCHHNNELYMHTLNYPNKLGLIDESLAHNSKFNSIEDFSSESFKELRTDEFIELMKASTLERLVKQPIFIDRNTLDINKVAKKNEKSTRKWPVTFTESLLFNLVQLKPLLKCLSDEQLTEQDANEFLKRVDTIKSCEFKKESIFNHLIVAPSSQPSLKLEDMYKKFWSELEVFVRAHQDLSHRHKLLYQSVKNICSNSNSLFNAADDDEDEMSSLIALATGGAKIELVESKNTNKRRFVELENEKLSKKCKKIMPPLMTKGNYVETNLLDYCVKKTVEKNKLSRPDFYARAVNPGVTVVPLYQNLKLDELSKSSVAKSIEIV